MSGQPAHWGSWMLTDPPVSAAFELHRKKSMLSQLSRQQLEDELVRLMEWDMLRKAQLNQALAVFTEMSARLAALEKPTADPLAPFVEMARSLQDGAEAARQQAPN